MSKKILRINGQDVELSGSGGGATKGIIEATDWALEYVQSHGSISDLMELLAVWSGTIAESGYETAEELIRHVADITIFADIEAIISASGGDSFGTQGVFYNFPIALLSGNSSIVTIYSRDAFVIQFPALSISDCDARLGEEMKYLVSYNDALSFLVGETRMCSFKLNA